MFDRFMEIVCVTGTCLLGGLVTWLVTLIVYLLGSLIFGTGVSEVVPVVALRIIMPAALVVGLVAGAVID